MTDALIQLADAALPAALLFEYAVLLLSWHRLQPKDLGLAEAMARAGLLSLSSLGFAILALFAAGAANAHALLDVFILAIALLSLKRGGRSLASDFRHLAGAVRDEPLAWFLGVSFLALALIALLVPPSNWDSMTYNLSRILVMRSENTLAPVNYNTVRQLVFSPGFDLLHYFFLRFSLDTGVAVFSLTAYASIVLGSYSLARNYGDRRFALAVAVAVGSLKLLVLQATSTKNDLGAAAMALGVLLALQSFSRKPSPREAPFFLACLLFGIAAKTYFALFLAVFLPVAALAYRKEMLVLARDVLSTPLLKLLGLAGAACLGLYLAFFSQITSLERFGSPYGPEAFVSMHRNHDGAKGAAANSLRYALQSADFPGEWWSKARADLHASLLGSGPGPGPGAAMDFGAQTKQSAQWTQDEGWFGPTGFLLIIPCALATLFLSGRSSRVAAWSMAGYFVLICFSIGWMSYNGRFLTLYIALSAPCIARAGRFWHGRTWIRRTVLGLSMLTMLCSILLNQEKPLLGYDSLGASRYDWAGSVFENSGRKEYDDHFAGPLLLDFLSRGTIPGSRVLLVANRDSWTYPLLLHGPHRWVVTGQENPLAVVDGHRYDIRDCDQFRKLGERFDLVVVMEMDELLPCAQVWREMMRTAAPWGKAVVFDPSGRYGRPK